MEVQVSDSPVISRILSINIIPNINDKKEYNSCIALVEDKDKNRYIILGENIKKDISIQTEFRKIFNHFLIKYEKSAYLKFNLFADDDEQILFKIIKINNNEDERTPITLKEIEEKLGYKISIVS